LNILNEEEYTVHEYRVRSSYATDYAYSYMYLVQANVIQICHIKQNME